MFVASQFWSGHGGVLRKSGTTLTLPQVRQAHRERSMSQTGWVAHSRNLTNKQLCV